MFSKIPAIDIAGIFICGRSELSGRRNKETLCRPYGARSAFYAGTYVLGQTVTRRRRYSGGIAKIAGPCEFLTSRKNHVGEETLRPEMGCVGLGTHGR